MASSVTSSASNRSGGSAGSVPGGPIRACQGTNAGAPAGQRGCEKERVASAGRKPAGGLSFEPPGGPLWTYFPIIMYPNIPGCVRVRPGERFMSTHAKKPGVSLRDNEGSRPPAIGRSLRLDDGSWIGGVVTLESGLRSARLACSSLGHGGARGRHDPARKRVLKAPPPPPCKHGFCQPSRTAWLRATKGPRCPICRAPACSQGGQNVARRARRPALSLILPPAYICAGFFVGVVGG